MRIRVLRHAALVGAGAALALSPLAAGPASAATTASEPAPSCVSLYQSWRYAQADNGCAETVTVKVVYEDDTEGLCYAVAPGQITTVGDGYIGQHGHARYLARCL
ncbi:alpha-amylase [Streptomyces griseosporeus]